MGADTRQTFEVEFENDYDGGRTIRVLADSEEDARSGALYWKKGYERIGRVRLVGSDDS